MAKFTVLFKDRTLQSTLFDTSKVHIGSDDSNDLVIDSLAVAPAHAVVSLAEGTAFIKQLNDNFPIIVNNQSTEEATLNNNDEIVIGKHKIIFHTTESVISPANTEPSEERESDEMEDDFMSELNLPDANLQVLGGKHIGRLIPLKKAMTRIGHRGNGVAVIARRKEGYFISCLEQNNALKVNQQQLEDETLKLSDNDLVDIDSTPMQFFLD